VMNIILLERDSSIVSNQQQLKHIKEVLKARVGDSLKVGELGGKIGRATIEKISKDKIFLKDIILDKTPPPKLDLTIVLALPRPKVLRRLIMDITSIGVKRLIVINSYKTQKSYWQSPLLNRVDEFIFEGLQQSIDTIPLEVEFKKYFKPFVEDEFFKLLSQDGAKGVVAHPYAKNSWNEYIKQERNLPKVLCIGAEGGWIDYEVDLLCRYGCEAISLGDRILRTESVVNAILGWWL